MRVAAGILMIVGGFLGGSILVGTLHGMHVYGVLLYLPAILAVIGGYCALKSKGWNWALAGAICSLLFPFFGIPAVILIVKSKDEFE